MNINDGDFKDLRKKLDVMGFNQTMPVLAIPLVSAIFGDLIKTTECLRDTKKQVADLLEEKACWELGVEPYKCDNSRLLAECNELHLQFLKEREDYELQLCELQREVRNLQTDKEHLQCHNQQLQHQLDAVLTKQINTATKRTQAVPPRQVKKPFISTVRAGQSLPPVLGGLAGTSAFKCTKCNAGIYQKTTTKTKDGITITNTSGQEELDKLQNDLSSANDQLEFYKRKVESRNREIRRLNDMLTGGRPPVALAKDCCYKEVGALSQDIDLLQREKTELMSQVREYQDKMHDAMQRALRTEEDKRSLQTHLDELKQAALQVEQQANSEIDAREHELRQLQDELKKLHLQNEQRTKERMTAQRLTAGTSAAMHNDKRSLNERLNVLTRREEELQTCNEKQKKKLHKMHDKMTALQKELREQMERHTVTLDEEKIRLRSERDFFQKEYLRMMSKAGSEGEIEFLQAQIKSKDDELRTLRTELCMTSASKGHVSPVKSALYETLTCTATVNNSNRSDCVQAAIARVERERDCARAELERFRCERDTLREKHLCAIQMHAEELQALRMRNESLQDRLRSIERENQDLNTAKVPAEINVKRLREDVDQLKQRLAAAQKEVEKLNTENSQITMLNDKNERIIADYQSRLIVAESKLHKADVRVNTLDSNRETSRSEVTQLRSEVAALRKTYMSLEHEKDLLLNQLDNKTERACKLEYELKDCKEKRNDLELKARELEEQIHKLTTRTRQRDKELNETSTESKTLRQQVMALKASRDEAISENGKLADKLSDAQVEVRTLQKSLKDSEQKVANMKQQLQQYVQEVKKAEDLLMEKDKEREELLDHYRNLTEDQVLLEGNNQTLEIEAAESKRQIYEMECEIRSYKEKLRCRQCAVEELEDKLSAARSNIRCLERQLEDSHDELRLLKIDLEARKELCDKLDVQKDKLNAELGEVNTIREKLVAECERLRSEAKESASIKQLTTETTEEMLARMHSELQRHYDADVKAHHELERLQRQCEKTLKELEEERKRCCQQGDLANQWQLQARELRQNLTEDRFREARTRQISPTVPSTTL
ncbi:centrosomal protein of 135 kDa isoform X2 [Scaptodrosophila lebanonensis]|uniref:Centrosomal protein of 135 kDa isoform X2 n=1 Tax=Drosophila lebanonensis TaxID=7225 RepID=A0A6J2UAR6_DROLE|nr:centrosomal protein of 135 kDa isoform X2 [Scaptodrosophila lebanonensis]